MRKTTMLLSTLLTLTCLAAPSVAGTHPPDRNGFMIGFGVGGSSAGLEDADGREASGTFNFRIGYAVRPDLVLHYEGAAWSKTFDGALGDLTWTFSTNTAALTYYPPNTGLFLRGGVGFGTASAELAIGGIKVSDDETGFGLLVATGWEWRLTDKFALAPQVEFDYQVLDQLGSANLIGGGLNFNWYW